MPPASPRLPGNASAMRVSYADLSAQPEFVTIVERPGPLGQPEYAVVITATELLFPRWEAMTAQAQAQAQTLAAHIHRREIEIETLPLPRRELARALADAAMASAQDGHAFLAALDLGLAGRPCASPS